MQMGGLWSRPPVQVHVLVLQLFLTPAPPEGDHARTLLAGLVAVTDHARSAHQA